MASKINARIYKEIMEENDLEESELVKFYLNEAKKCQRYIQTLKAHGARQNVIDQQEYEKGKWIWTAIIIAMDEKEQGWRYAEDGPAIEPMLKQQLEDIKEAKRLRGA